MTTTPEAVVHAPEVHDRPAYVRADGYVYCHEHGSIHDDTTNPFGESRESWCHKREHRPVYFRARRGDWK